MLSKRNRLNSGNSTLKSSVKCKLSNSNYRFIYLKYSRTCLSIKMNLFQKTFRVGWSETQSLHKYISITSLTVSSSIASNFCCNTRIICTQHSLASCNLKSDTVSNPGRYSVWFTKYFQNNYCFLREGEESCFVLNIKPN